MRTNRTDHKIAVFLVAFVILITIIGLTLYFNKGLLSYVKAAILNQKIEKSESVQKAADLVGRITQEVAPTETKSTIAKEPPKYGTSNKINGSATSNPDGSKTIVVSDGASCPDLSKMANLGPNGSTPNSIKYVDETKSNPALENVLKDFMSSQLRWGNEINYMYQITLQNAGNTGWEGQYCGSYTINSKGDIVSAFGYVILNNYYHKDSPQFTDYMKLVLSHEYGHHYTLYHKWVDMDSPAGVRFPDSYYSARPLSKAATTTDCSASWSNCEVEIVAEDYSYFYSGYGYHAMSGAFGYPSAAIKTWLNSLASTGLNVNQGQTTPTPSPAPDTTPPQVSITEPLDSSNLTGEVAFRASASDDVGVLKVVFYVDNDFISEDSTAPYEAQIDTAAYADGSHALKAVAYDSAQSAEDSENVTFSNNQTDTENPVATIFNPNSNPFDWPSGDLILEARATDNKSVSKMEFYVGDQLLADRKGSYIGIRIGWFDGHPGDYIFRVKAYDAAGNVGETTITITKQ